MGWPIIRQGKSALITAPTGSGKTPAAFLWGLNDLWSRALDGEDIFGVKVLYISPLRALGNDAHRNLEVPLEGVRAKAAAFGAPLPELTRAVRSGDTSQADRQAMLCRPPHVLITTPESLYLLLTSPRARRILTTVRSGVSNAEACRRTAHATCWDRREARIGSHFLLTGRRTGGTRNYRPQGPLVRPSAELRSVVPPVVA